MERAINLQPYTILCGSNSSGKSSLIQGILLLCQTFGRRFQDNTIILNGNIVRLGSFNDIKRHLSESNKIKIGFSIPLNIPHRTHLEKTLQYEIEFGSYEKQDDIYHPTILSTKITLLNETGEKLDEIEISTRNDDDKNSCIIDRFEGSQRAIISNIYPDHEIISCNEKSIIPYVFNIKYNHTKLTSSRITDYLTNEICNDPAKSSEKLNDEIELPASIFSTLSDLIKLELKHLSSVLQVPKEIAEAFNKLNNERHTKFKREKLSISGLKEQLISSHFPLKPELIDKIYMSSDSHTIYTWKLFLNQLKDKEKSSLIELIKRNKGKIENAWYEGSDVIYKECDYRSRSLQEIDDLVSLYFSKSIKYLGPLRNEPQAVYASFSNNESYNIGLKGEYTASILHLNKDKSITYLSPRLISGKISFENKTTSLTSACQDWLSYLGVAQEFNTKDKGKLGYELYVKTTNNEDWQDLTHVGVGVSQVLPIVLMFLLSHKDEILIFEQPELHLHPKVQSLLCDLFIAMSMSGLQCIIETHSEYIINRLRLRVAQETNQNIVQNSSVFFINKIDGTTNFDNVEINKYGAIKDWPIDFFDQSDKEVEKILLEASRKIRKEKNEGDGE